MGNPGTDKVVFYRLVHIPAVSEENRLDKPRRRLGEEAVRPFAEPLVQPPRIKSGRPVSRLDNSGAAFCGKDRFNPL